MTRRRWREKREEELKGTPYDSLLEKRLHEGKLKDCGFHTKEFLIDYSVPHTYEPDFIFEKDGKTFLIETKGRFQDNTEARKYLFIREALDAEKFELVFVWQKAGTRFPFARKRLDGTYATHKEYADKHGFRNWTQDEFELELL